MVIGGMTHRVHTEQGLTDWVDELLWSGFGSIDRSSDGEERSEIKENAERHCKQRSV